MKPLLLSFVLSPAFLCAQWSQQVSGVSANLEAIQFVDELNGFCVGENGLVLRTTDGGDNWTNSTVGSGYVWDLYFLEADNGFIQTNSMVYRTTNGIDFEPLQLILDGIPDSDTIVYQPVGCSFDFDGPIGVVAASYTDSPQTQPMVTRQWKTIDFGATWEEMATTAQYGNMEFLDEQHWFAADFYLHETVDGGQTWDTCGANYFSFPPYNRDCFKILDGTGRGLISMAYHLDFSYIVGFDQPNVGSSVLHHVIDMEVQASHSRFLAFESNVAVVRTSLDQGLSLLPGSEPLPGAWAIDFISDGRGWACGDGGKIWKYANDETAVAEGTEPHSQLILFPNPGGEIISIEHTLDRVPELILIRDVSGKVIVEMAYSSFVDIGGLAPGNYSMTIVAKGQRASGRFQRME